MHLPITFGLLGLLTAAVLLLRLCWWRLPRWVRRSLIVLAAAMVMMRIASDGLQWSTVSTRLNALLSWGAVGGYEILLARFSLMRPQWLTSLSAIVLLAPLIGSALMLPLTRVFDWSHADISSIGGSYIVEKSPWDTDAAGNTGVDLIVFYSPRFAPFLRHLRERASFSSAECRTEDASVKADLTARTLHFHCPPRVEGKPALDVVLPLR
jgi:hypothetical protein